MPGNQARRRRRMMEKLSLAERDELAGGCVRLFSSFEVVVVVVVDTHGRWMIMVKGKLEIGEREMRNDNGNGKRSAGEGEEGEGRLVECCVGGGCVASGS
jgi:hypothetical protein